MLSFLLLRVNLKLDIKSDLQKEAKNTQITTLAGLELRLLKIAFRSTILATLHQFCVLLAPPLIITNPSTSLNRNFQMPLISK